MFLFDWFRRWRFNLTVKKIVESQRKATSAERRVISKFILQTINEVPLIVEPVICSPTAREIFLREEDRKRREEERERGEQGLATIHTPYRLETVLDKPEERPVDYGTANAEVEPGFYATWMDAIRAKLPSDVKIGHDLMVYVTFGNGFGKQKVTWKAKTPRGGEYLMAMIDSSSHPELSEQKKLEEK